MADVIKDVHTEHCCAQHGCKYSDSDCPVASGNKPQSYPCESCEWEKEEAAHATAAKDAEIEALRVDLEAWKASHAMLTDTCHHFQARADRLAEALQHMVSEAIDGGHNYMMQAIKDSGASELLRGQGADSGESDG